MNHFEVEAALKSMTILIDTREQDTSALKRRVEAMGKPTERIKLNVGDYSCKCPLPEGGECSLADSVAIERKMNLDELCNCFASGRGRFQREFERAAESGMTVYLIVEDASWESVFAGKYRSRYTSNALVASILAWTARYNIKLMFCRAETTGQLISKILHYELKERLQSGEADNEFSGTA